MGLKNIISYIIIFIEPLMKNLLRKHLLSMAQFVIPISTLDAPLPRPKSVMVPCPGDSMPWQGWKSPWPALPCIDVSYVSPTRVAQRKKAVQVNINSFLDQFRIWSIVWCLTNSSKETCQFIPININYSSPQPIQLDVPSKFDGHSIGHWSLPHATMSIHPPNIVPVLETVPLAPTPRWHQRSRGWGCPKKWRWAGNWGPGWRNLQLHQGCWKIRWRFGHRVSSSIPVTQWCLWNIKLLKSY